MRLELETFSSKISRRIFSTFVICALVPVGCVAVLTYFKVTRHLEVQALDSLRHAAKSQTKTFVDRLKLAESELRLIDSLIDNRKRIEPYDLDELLRDRLQKRFSNITLVRIPNEPQPLINPQAIPPVRVASEDIKHLSAGYPLLAELTVSSSTPSIMLMRLVDPKKTDRGLWVGEINPNFLWATGKMSNRPLDTEFCVLDSSYRLLYSSRPNLAKIAELLKLKTQASTSGHFEFSAGGEPFIASYTQMFVKQYFKLPHWTVILFKPKSDVFAPLAEFKTNFPAIIILTLMVVMWLCIVNIRKNLVPIGALKEGAQRIAVRDFSKPVKVSHDDEFADLAAAFNEMSEALNHKFKTLSVKAEIDRAVVSTLDPDEIIKAAITRIADCVACRVYGISLIDVSASARNRVLYCFEFERQTILTETISITPHERRVLEQNPNYLMAHANDPRPHYLPRSSHLSLPNLLIFPVWVKKKLAAILWLAGSLSE